MLRTVSAVLLTLALQAPAAVQEIDPAFQTLVQRFFATQQAEDVEGYLALWSRSADKPKVEQLRFVFNGGDDVFTDIAVLRARVDGDTARLRVSASRARTFGGARSAQGPPPTMNARLQLSLVLAREDGEWRIVREAAPSDELAVALIETADPELRRRLLEADPELVNERLIDAISRRADQLAQVGKYQAAQVIYELSLELAKATKNPRAEGQALQNIANSQYFQRRFAEALKAYQERLALARDTNNETGMASALVGIGTVLYSTFDYGAALTAYRDALAIQERLGDINLIGTTLISTGNVFYLQGDYAAAIADYRRAEELKRKANDLAGAASALEGLGRVYASQGDYAAALNAFAAVLEERRTSRDGPRQALVLYGIGDIHFRLGNTDEARAAYNEARQLFEKFRDLGSAGRALQGTALTELVVARFPAAEKAYTESITACTAATEPDAECIARAQVGLAFALAAQEKFDDAVTWYGRSLTWFNTLQMEEAGARARIGLAEALYGRGDYEKALEQAVTARRTAIALKNDDVLWRALVSAARAERKLGQPAQALGSARAAVLAVQQMAAAAVDKPGSAAPADGASAYAALALLQSEDGDAAGAFNSIEAMRAYSLRAALAGSEREIARGMTSDERAEEHRLATALNTLLAQRASEKGLPRPDAARLATLERAIADATAQRGASQQKLFSRLPELRTWRGLGTVATAEDLPTLLDAEGKALLQLVVDEHDIVVVLAARKSGDAGVVLKARTTPVKRQALAERIARAMDGNALSSIVSWRAASKEVFSILPRDIIDELAAAMSVVVVPDDTLWRIPFEALTIRDAYLADSASVTYATSLTAAVTPTAASIPATLSRIAAVAAPVLPAPLVEDLKATAPTWTLRLPDAAMLEVAALKAMRQPDAPETPVLTGEAATKSAAIAAAANADALHIAAPFRISSASPLFSRILLAAPPAAAPVTGQPPPESAPNTREAQLDAREVFNLTSSAHVVMLSDPSALSMRDASRGIPPIQWAWRAAGATTVIIRRWGGGEDLSNQVVAVFYEQLAAGKTPARALAAARAAVRETEAGRAPAAWAGWIVISGR